MIGISTTHVLGVGKGPWVSTASVLVRRSRSSVSVGVNSRSADWRHGDAWHNSYQRLHGRRQPQSATDRRLSDARGKCRHRSSGVGSIGARSSADRQLGNILSGRSHGVHAGGATSQDKDLRRWLVAAVRGSTSQTQFQGQGRDNVPFVKKSSNN